VNARLLKEAPAINEPSNASAVSGRPLPRPVGETGWFAPKKPSRRLLFKRLDDTADVIAQPLEPDLRLGPMQ